MPHVEANGIRLHYQEQGEGDPLLFISGLGRNHTSWSLVVPSFAKKHRCVVFDNRGAGLSGVPPGPYTIEQMADDAAALLDALGIAQADCAGVSLGGSVLQALAFRHPAKVRRAVLVSAFPSYTEIQHAWLDTSLALRAAGADPRKSFISNMPWVFTPRLLSSHEEAARYVDLATKDPYPTTNEGFAAQAQAIRTFDSRDRLAAITAEVLLLVGAEDILTPVHQSVEMAELIPRAHLRVLPRGGHSMTAEYMDDVVRAIRRWLDG